jgi:hypothetical protein
MRRLEVERIDGVPARIALAGLGPEMRPLGLKFRPPTPVDGLRREPQVWCGARAPCLARTAPGRRRGTARMGTTARPRGAR